MKLGELIIPGALLLGIYLLKDTLAGALQGPAAAAPQTLAPSIITYPPQVYHTILPVVPSEPGVSEGVLPPDFQGEIPICPSLTPVTRYPGDDQLCCQCPGGWLHCGSEWNMKTQAEQGLILAVCNL